MTYEELKSLIAGSPSIKLLRAKSAPITLSFLYREFKENNRVAISGFELTNSLAEYIDSLDEEDFIDIELNDSLSIARKYIDQWCSEDNRYISRYPDENGEPTHELTTHTEKAFQWIESLKKREFVGTESRFRNIYQQLQELIDNTANNPKQKILELEKKRKEITRQINEIKKTGLVPTFNDTQIKERFFNINKTARELTSDFKEVEQNFRDITLNLYKKQTQKDVHKGQILGYTLDATDELKQSDQGKSFYAFWQFLIADSKQDDLINMIAYTYQLMEERNIGTGDDFLKKIKIFLHNAGQKVIDSNHLLADKLTRILAERDQREWRKTRETINEIKNLAVQKVGQFNGKRNFISIEGLPFIDMTLDRPLGEPTQIAQFDKQPSEVGSQQYDQADMSSLFNRFDLDQKELEIKIEEVLQNQFEISLEELIKIYPIQNGLAEVITYFIIASQSDIHIINEEIKEAIIWINTKEAIERSIQLPQIIFKKKQAI